MTSSYSQDGDVLNAYDIRGRSLAPARFAQAVTLDTELPIYGRLRVSNSHATATQNIAVVLASNVSGDTTATLIPIAPMWSGIIPVVARRVLSSGTGNISAVVMA